MAGNQRQLKISPNQERILSQIESGLTFPQIVRASSVSKAAIWKTISKLRSRGMVSDVGMSVTASGKEYRTLAIKLDAVTMEKNALEARLAEITSIKDGAA